ncbi:PDZ domain-containing protein [Pirellulaceae bacterium]|jgi:predicted metalloprotease with PDZ domain|nr:PDZ domain-containing protein [bacterium]MDB4650625.1 PDZ domain-containing protein [Pirellulaceae bacterium]
MNIRQSHSVRYFVRSVIFYALFAAWASFSTSHAAEVRYVLKFENAQNHYVDITAIFDTTSSPQLEIFMPVWTPGSYLVREYARNIESISATDESGKKLDVQKTKKNRWKIGCSNTKKVAVNYRLYCREMSVRTNWVEEKFAILNGAPTFITEINSRKLKHVVEFELPSQWKTVASGLLPVVNHDRHFVATDFDYLVDSPIILGNPSIETFEVGGVPHQLISQGGDGLWDFKKAAEDVAKIVAEHQKIWGVVPYKDYKFLNAIVESGGGLEHDNSTLMMTSRWNFGQRTRYLSWLGLVSHEFFHTWNIRRLRPVELVKYDYENENYFTTLWIAEGVTSYYDDLAVKRAGLYSEKEYLTQLSKQIRSLQTTEGRLTQSLSESSYDAWIKYYRQDENSKNSQISYYTKGAVAAFLLDAEIRSATDGKKSLDNVLQELYTKYSGDRGYSSKQFRDLVSAIAGKDLSGWFAKAIDSTDELDYQAALSVYGLEFKKEKEKEKEDDDAKTVLWTGLSLKTNDGKVEVSSVVRNSPGFKSGINVGDELISIDGYRLTSSDLTARLKAFKPGDMKEVLTVRRGQIVSRNMTMEAKPKSNWTIVKIAKPTEKQTANLNQWLANKPPKKKEDKSGKTSPKVTDSEKAELSQ